MAVRLEVLDEMGEPRDGATLVLEGARVLIGRGPACDVRLPEVSISLRHASLEVTGGRVQIRDERSTNGTFAGSVPVRPGAPVTLESPSEVRVGRVRLRVTTGTFAAEGEPAVASRALAYSLVAEALVARGVDVTPVVRCTSGEDAGASLRLDEDGRAYRVGRDEEADLVLHDDDCSRDHAQLTRRGGVVLLRDLNAKTRTLLGEVEVSTKRDVPWRLGAPVTIGHSVLELDDPLGKTLAAIECEPDAIVPLEAPTPADSAEPAGTARRPSTTRPRPRATRDDSAPTRAELAILVTSLVVLALSAVGLVLVLRR